MDDIFLGLILLAGIIIEALRVTWQIRWLLACTGYTVTVHAVINSEPTCTYNYKVISQPLNHEIRSKVYVCRAPF